MRPPKPGVRLLPNAITVLALCSGLSAVQYALAGRHALAVAAIVVAAALDAADGRIARRLDAASRTGAELDSLADAVSFGVAPALVLFAWGLDDYRAGWTVALVYVVCVVLRLARFNTLLDDPTRPMFSAEFFVGVPSPAGALLVLGPLVVWLQFGAGWWSSPLVIGAWTVLIAFLMISRVPTLSFKRVRVPQQWIMSLLLMIMLTAIVVVSYPLVALLIAMVAYLAHLPYAIWRYRWLSEHPETWDMPGRQRRAMRRARRRRPPFRRQVAGAAVRASAAVRGRGRGLRPRRRDGDRTGDQAGDQTGDRTGG